MAVLAMTILLLLFTAPATAALNRWTGIHSRGAAGRAATLRTLTVVVLVGLLFALDPELRAFLVVLDAIGVDIFLMLLFVQGREILYWLTIAACLPVVRLLETWGWFPLPLPQRALLKQHPWWTVYAAIQPVVMVLIVVWPLAALLNGSRKL
jgi:hypothetical protein